MTDSPIVLPYWMRWVGALLWWLCFPVRYVWGEITGLRTEPIRSISVVAGIVMMFRGYDHIEHGDSLADPHVAVTLIGLAMTFGLAWQATYIKGQVAGMQMQIGAQPSAAQRMFDQDVATMPTAARTPAPDTPDGGA